MEGIFFTIPKLDTQDKRMFSKRAYRSDWDKRLARSRELKEKVRGDETFASEAWLIQTGPAYADFLMISRVGCNLILDTRSPSISFTSVDMASEPSINMGTSMVVSGGI